MLMGLMRKQAKSWVIKFMIAIIALVFIFYFGVSPSSRKVLKIANVNGEVIDSFEYEKTYRDLVEAFRRQYKDTWNDSLIKKLDLKNRALNNLINQKLIRQEAKRFGLDVTDDEIQNAIMEYPAFQINGQFDMRRYRLLLSDNHMKPEDFEQSIALDLLQNKIEQFLDTFNGVTEQELLDYFTFANEEVMISLVRFKADLFKESVKPDEASMKDYYNKHKQQYRVPEKIKLEYLMFDHVSFRDKVKTTDHEIKDYYQANIDSFQIEKQVEARHILFKSESDAGVKEEKKVREKAMAVLEKARKGKDFAGLAKKYSEGPLRSKGGDLGYFPAGRMVKSFEEAAFKLKKGEISDLVRTRFGFHIIKVEDIKDAKTKPLDEVRDEIRDIITKRKSMELAREKALSLIDQMPYDLDIASYADEQGLKVKYTDYFSEEGRIPGLGGDKKLVGTLFNLRNKEISDLVELQGKLYIFQVTDRNASYVPEIKVVSDKVKNDLSMFLATGKAKEAAENYLARIKEGKEWDEVATDKHSKPMKTDFLTRRSSIPQIGYAPDLVAMAFHLDKDNRFPDKIFQNERDAFVIRWEERKGIDEKKYQEEKDKYRSILEQVKKKRTFENWLENLKKKADIKIIKPAEQL